MQDRPELYYKLKDMQVLYKGFFDYLEGNFITQEEVLDVLGRVAEKSRKLKDSVVVLDGYTGFTPIQQEFWKSFCKSQAQVYVTVTMGTGEDPYQPGSPHQLFYLSKQTVGRLCRLAQEHGIYWDEQWLPLRGEPYQGRFAEEPP